MSRHHCALCMSPCRSTGWLLVSRLVLYAYGCGILTSGAFFFRRPKEWSGTYLAHFQSLLSTKTEALGEWIHFSVLFPQLLKWKMEMPGFQLQPRMETLVYFCYFLHSCFQESQGTKFCWIVCIIHLVLLNTFVVKTQERDGRLCAFTCSITYQ